MSPTERSTDSTPSAVNSPSLFSPSDVLQQGRDVVSPSSEEKRLDVTATSEQENKISVTTIDDDDEDSRADDDDDSIADAHVNAVDVDVGPFVPHGDVLRDPDDNP